MKSNKLIGHFLETLDSLDKEGVKIPGLIMSSPGYGKTTTVEMWCKYHDYNLTTLIASQYSQDDILGIQAVSNGKLERLTPAWFNFMLEKSQNGKRNVLFIDEITTCDEFVQAPLLNLIFSRNLGLHTLPQNTLIITAGNYSEELNGVFSMTAPLVNRFMILNLVVSDFDMEEVILQKINEVTDISEYLGLGYDTKDTIDPDSLGRFIFKNISFSESTIINNSKYGLVGFASVRSVHNSISFFKKWISLYEDSEWSRIVGDTLGTTERSTKKVLIRDLISKNLKWFGRKPSRKDDDVDSGLNKCIQALVTGKSESSTEYSKALMIIESQGVTSKELRLLQRVANINNYLRSLYDKASSGEPDVLE